MVIDFITVLNMMIEAESEPLTPYDFGRLSALRFMRGLILTWAQAEEAQGKMDETVVGDTGGDRAEP